MTKNTIKKYTQFITSVEKRGTRRLYHIGENFIVEAMTCEHNLENKNDIMNIWKKSRRIEKALPTHISIDTFFTDKDGNCWGYYNVTHKKSEDGKRVVIDFDYLREATEENELELVAECVRMQEMDIRNK